MQPRDFCYWLQGFFELTKTDELTPEQVGEIKKHLYNVFQHDCEKIQYKEGQLLCDVRDFTPRPRPDYPLTDGVIVTDIPLYGHPDGRGNIMWSSLASC